MSMRWHLICSFNLHFPHQYYAGHLSHASQSLIGLLWRNVCWRTVFKSDWFLLMSFRSYIFWISIPCPNSLKYFLPFGELSFSPPVDDFNAHNFWIFKRSHLSVVSLVTCTFDIRAKNSLPNLMSMKLLSFSLWSILSWFLYIVLGKHSTSSFSHVHSPFFQHHLFPCLLSVECLDILVKSYWLHVQGFISKLSALSPWLICLSWALYYCSALILSFSKTVLHLQGSREPIYIFKIIFFISAKNIIRNLIGIALYL